MTTSFDEPRRIDEDPDFPADLRSLLTALHADCPSAAVLERTAARPRFVVSRVVRRHPWRATAMAAAAAALILVGTLGVRDRSRPAALGPEEPRARGGDEVAMVATAFPAPEAGLLFPAGSSVPLPVGEDLATLDFESAWETASPTRQIAGRRVQGPPGRIGGRASLAGVIFTPEQKSFGVQVRDAAGLFPYADDVLVAFDYWIGEWTAPEPPQMVVGIQFGWKGPEYEMPVPDPVAVRWMTAVVRLEGLRAPFRRDRSGRLKDFRAPTPPDRQRRPSPGEIATMFKVRVEGVREDVLFVDNIRIVRPTGR